MAATERVTVRMSRGDTNTPWGFRLQGGQEYGGPLSIGSVNEGSLADRAGLLGGDRLLEIGGQHASNIRHQNAQDTIMRSGNTLDLVVERLASRSWKPLMPPVDFPASTEITTTSTGARPFGQPQENYSTSRRVVTEQYSNTKPSSTDQYLQHTGGLFGTDPKLTAPKQDPNYLKSETLRMIKESESRTSGGSGTTSQPYGGSVPSPAANITSGGGGSAPSCDNCGRLIHGVFCKAGGKTLHGDCFKCATCGGSLKNIGYFLVNGKLYCDLHARQQQENQFRAAPPVDPNLFNSYPAAGSLKPVEPVKAFYQPSILNKGPVSVHVPPPGSLSPQARESSNYSSSYRKTTKTTTSSSNQQQQHEPYGAPSWEQQPSPRPIQSQISPRPQTYTGSAPSPRPAYNLQSDRTVSTKETKWGGGVGGGAPGGGFGAGRQPAAGARIPRRGKGILKQLHEAPRIPVCESCTREIRGPFVLALNKTWCPDHFVCATQQCRRKLLDIGFVEENGATHCEFCYEKYLAPPCSKCSRSVVGDCLTALGRQWHPECFVCAHCHKPIGNSAFYMENGQPYCENDWSSLFTTKCVSCQFAIDPGDRWVEALGSSYHSECFCCSVCQKNLEGQSFFAKGGRPFCKAHA